MVVLAMPNRFQKLVKSRWVNAFYMAYAIVDPDERVALLVHARGLEQPAKLLMVHTMIGQRVFLGVVADGPRWRKWQRLDHLVEPCRRDRLVKRLYRVLQVAQLLAQRAVFLDRTWVIRDRDVARNNFDFAFHFGPNHNSL